MKVILLAAGLGTRLRPITDTIPKCLVPVKGKPLLQIWLENLNYVGLNDFLINTHYLSNQVDSFINNSIYKENCVVRNEKILLGTAGTLLSNLDYIGDEDCLLIHADNYCLADIKKFLEAHKKRPKKCLMTMLTFRTNKPSTCGIVEVDKNNILVDFFEKVDNPPGNLANGAVYILSKELINILATKNQLATDFSNDIIPYFKNKIFTYETKELFIDIGTINTYIEANNS